MSGDQVTGLLGHVEVLVVGGGGAGLTAARLPSPESILYFAKVLFPPDRNRWI